MLLLCPHCLVLEAAYVTWDGEGGKKPLNKMKPLSVSNFGLLMSPKAKKAHSSSKGLSGGHPIRGRASGTPLRAAEGSVERSLKDAKMCNCLSPDQAAEHTGVLLQSPPQVCLESKSRGTLALLFIQQLPGLNEKLLPKAA